ncbi:MAG TPA: hypothetical protein VHN82_00310 [Methanoregula sp.]|nr:hypothetical protein [Methanoregula sp.]
MKRLVLLLMGLLFFVGLAAGYQINIDTPASLAIGKPLVVNGDTTLGTGTPVDVVLYRQLTTSSEIKRITVYVQSDKTFKAIFNTADLTPGDYKVEVPSPAGGDSVFMRNVRLFDRAEDIILTTPLTQNFTGKIYLTGEIRGLANSGIQVEVTDPNGLVVYGPQYIHTDNDAHFASEITLKEPGIYEVSFTDANGYVGSRAITSLNPSTPAGSGTPAITPTPNTVVISAHARASRDAPAYFIVTPGIGTVSLYTSKSLDWVIEYIDDRGILHMENGQGDQSPEKVLFTGKGKTIYVKIYPYKYSVTSDVFLYGENVDSIVVSPTVPVPFSSGEAGSATTQATPLLPFAGILALTLVIAISRRS